MSLGTPQPVVFDFASFISYYPMFGSVSTIQAQDFFDRACALIDNMAASRIPYSPNGTPPVYTRALILNAAVAHFCYLFTPDATGNVRPVGRISQASEGTVSASFEYSAPHSDIAAFWNQTAFGSYVWIALLPYRSARYIPGPGASRRNGLGRGGFYAGGLGRF